MFTLTTPVTGAPQAGLTTPTYGLTEDSSLGPNSRQWVVSNIGGTQTGVEAHSASNPFTIAIFKPKMVKVRGNPDANGVYRSVATNQYKCVVRKGVAVGNDVKNVDVLTVTIRTHAGADVVDPESVRAAQSLLFGALFAHSSDLGDLVTSGY